jgi:hypothetical protein
MSAPVWRMVAMTLSRETRWRPSACSASDAAAIALIARKALRRGAVHPLTASPGIRIVDIFLPKNRDRLHDRGASGLANDRARIEERIFGVVLGTRHCQRSEPRDGSSSSPSADEEGERKISPPKIARNPLKNLDSAERIQGNPSFSNPLI